MLLDARDVTDGSVLRSDVCVVGAGAAGITIARGLASRGIEVLLLESGGFEPHEPTQELYAGELPGEPMTFGGEQVGLDWLRLRRFGGSTQHWGGWCHPLESSDFERRDWMPDSGWPFERSELEPYYARAQGLCELGPNRYDPGFWVDRGAGPPVLDSERLESTVFQLSPPTRFGDRYRDELVDAPRVRVCLWANVVDLVLDGSRVSAARVATLDGPRFRVEARRFVLATGGLEVARLLLASRSDRPAGLGNAHDLVGRYFSDHPHIEVPCVLSPSVHDLRFYGLGSREVRDESGVRREVGINGALVVRPEVRRRLELPGLVAVFDFWDASRDDDAAVSSTHVAELLRSLGAGPAEFEVDLSLRLEQRPNPDSRVRLLPETDALGMPRIEVDWRLSEDDREGLSRNLEVITEDIARAGMGRIRVAPEGIPIGDRHPDVGAHHMGTARMHRDPRRGVVDADGRVHDLANLYLAGSAVFPTYGWANPTLTIVALALRLADHLAAGRGDTRAG